jgi:hypothetical protein
VSGATNLPMGPGVIIFSINSKYLLGELKFLACGISSQFLSNPPPMMPTNICHLDQCSGTWGNGKISYRNSKKYLNDNLAVGWID